MAVSTYEQLALGWSPESKRDHIFNIIAAFVFVGFISAGIILSSIPVPKEKRDTRLLVPERVAKFITEKPKPKPKPKEAPRQIPIPPPLPKPIIQRRKPEPSKPLTKIEKKARKTAENSGLLALTNQLSDLIDTQNVDRMVGNKIQKSSNNTKAAEVSSDVLTAGSGRGSAGVNQNIHAAGSGRSAKLDNNQRQLASKLLASHGEIAAHTKNTNDTGGTSNVRGDNVRAEEDVAYIMDEHKSILHALYRRARRSNPGLKGKIVLEITILPSGKVSNIRIVSSELKDQTLEARLLERIKQFNFGARPVETLTVTVPVVFLPS